MDASFFYDLLIVAFFILFQLLDLCILDVRSPEFSYGLLAASALFHFSSLELVMKVSGMIFFLFFFLCISFQCLYLSKHLHHNWLMELEVTFDLLGFRAEVVWLGGVCEMDGPFRHVNPWSRQLIPQDIQRNSSRWYAQYPDPCPLLGMAGKFTLFKLLFV